MQVRRQAPPHFIHKHEHLGHSVRPKVFLGGVRQGHDQRDPAQREQDVKRDPFKERFFAILRATEYDVDVVRHSGVVDFFEE